MVKNANMFQMVPGHLRAQILAGTMRQRTPPPANAKESLRDVLHSGGNMFQSENAPAARNTLSTCEHYSIRIVRHLLRLTGAVRKYASEARLNMSR